MKPYYSACRELSGLPFLAAIHRGYIQQVCMVNTYKVASLYKSTASAHYPTL